MRTEIDVSAAVSIDQKRAWVHSRLSSFWQAVALTCLGVIFALSLLSAVLSITHLNQWDRIPAVELSRAFPEITQDAVVFYVLINEPLWFLLNVFFVVATARSLFQRRLIGAEIPPVKVALIG